MAEQSLHHQDHVLVRMIIVIPKNDMVSRLTFWFPLSSGARFCLHRNFRFQSAFVFFRHGLNLHSYSKKLSSPPSGWANPIHQRHWPE
jgi:hypothetical protein